MGNKVAFKRGGEQRSTTKNILRTTWSVIIIAHNAACSDL